MSERQAVILSGSLGLGHDVLSQTLTTSLERLSWRSTTVDCMGLLGSVEARIGDQVFRRLTSWPGLYDALHFAHFRPGSGLTGLIDRESTRRLVPALEAELERQPADLLFSVFATGASAAAKLKAGGRSQRVIVMCTDVCLYRLWVWEEVDLFLVTSEAAAASVRRYVPKARIEIVPPPVRDEFYRAPSQLEARLDVGIAPDAPCVLVMGGGWGLGPMEQTARALATAGVRVLVVAGHNRALERRLRRLAGEESNVLAYGFTDEVPTLMAASDVVVTTPGATTCSEARVVGRTLMLLDVVPGHGRENLQHELEVGDAEVCNAQPAQLVAAVRAVLDRVERPLRSVVRPAGEWDRALAQALVSVGLETPGLTVSLAGVGANTRGHAPPAERSTASHGSPQHVRHKEEDSPMMRTLFLHPPSYEGFDGGAGSRYQAKREIKSFWYPTWLAQPAAIVPGSKLVDAPAAGLSLDEVLPLAGQYDLAIMHTSSPSFRGDVGVAEAFKAANPDIRIGLVGAKVAVEPEASLLASDAIDFVAREEFDFTVAEIAEGRPLEDVDGVTFRDRNGMVVHTADRTILEDMDRLPYVTEVYKRDLHIEDYFIGYLKHPYVSLYTGRGCRSQCTFCLWPQTVGGHRYRTRSVEHVLAEMALIPSYFPQVKEVFFDDDTFTDDRPRAEEIARGLGKLGLTWSCNAKANVPYETLRAMRDNGLRLLLVGYESGSEDILKNIKKGVRVDRARQFTKDCRDLGITIHGTFIVGLPGETRETIEQTIQFAKDINPHSLQVSIAAPYPGTALYRQAKENGWLPDDDAALIDEHGIQTAALEYPHLNRTEIFDSVETFYKKFYFRAGKIAEMSAEMMRSPDMMKRRLREGVEFVSFLRRRKTSA